jgi:hypothetical protein
MSGEAGNSTSGTTTRVDVRVAPDTPTSVSLQASPNATCALGTAEPTPQGTENPILYADDRGLLQFDVGASADIRTEDLLLTCMDEAGRQTQRTLSVTVDTLAVPASAQPELVDPFQGAQSIRPALSGDPAIPSQEALIAAGYPLRPPVGSPGYSEWLNVVSRPSRMLAAKLIQTTTFHGPAQNATPQTFNSSSGTSGNWSGFVLNQGGVPYTFAEAKWTTPTLAYKTGFKMAEWVGLDGYGTNDVVQDGTSAVGNCFGYMCAGWAASYYAWIEYFPNSEVQISNFSVARGDELFAEAWEGDSAGNLNPSGGYGWFYVYNYRTGVTYQGAIAKPGNAPAFSGGTAEWIVEDPNSGQNLLPLPNYQTASIFNIEALKFNDTTGRNLGTDSSVNVTMQRGSTVLSTVSQQSVNSMLFTWHHG